MDSDTATTSRYHGGMTTKWKTMVVRLTAEQHKKLAALAREKDRSMASIVRLLIDRAA